MRVVFLFLMEIQERKIFRSRKLFDEPCGNCEYLSYCGGCRKAAYERTSRLQGADVTCFKDCVSLD